MEKNQDMCKIIKGDNFIMLNNINDSSLSEDEIMNENLDYLKINENISEN